MQAFQHFIHFDFFHHGVETTEESLINTLILINLMKLSGVRQSKIFKWPLGVKGLTETTLGNKTLGLLSFGSMETKPTFVF